MANIFRALLFIVSGDPLTVITGYHRKRAEYRTAAEIYSPLFFFPGKKTGNPCGFPVCMPV
jgi:hypothetical protein